MTRDDIDAWVDYQARAERRASAAADVLLAVVIGVLLAVAVVYWLTPCEGAASLCMAVVGFHGRHGNKPRLRRPYIPYVPLGCDQQGRLPTGVRLNAGSLDRHLIDMGERRPLPQLLAAKGAMQRVPGAGGWLERLARAYVRWC